ncbi:MAG: TRAP transporter small permease subunit [Sphingomonas sp.]|uniref:TRAP transporter small permease subunit n=1 Tax=Sphingomonas sp. TaxID=28214 RepID=UPI003567E4D1
MLGRHVGFAVNGSIELFRVCAVVALSSSILLATLDARHAAVDLLLLWVPDRGKAWLGYLAAGASAAAFGLITIGSIWVATGLWSTVSATAAAPARGDRACAPTGRGEAAGAFR